MVATGLHMPLGREARQPWLRAALFLSALAVSLALHGLLLAEFPALPSGRPAESWRKPRPLVLGAVRARPDLPAFRQPEQFRPENPEAFAEVAPLQKNLLEDLRAGAEALAYTPPPPAEAAPPAPVPPAGRPASVRTRRWRRSGQAAPAASQAARQRRRRRTARRPVEQLDRVHHRHARAAGDLGQAADVAGGDHIGLGRLEIGDLALAQAPGQLRLQEVVGAR